MTTIFTQILNGPKINTDVKDLGQKKFGNKIPLMGGRKFRDGNADWTTFCHFAKVWPVPNQKYCVIHDKDYDIMKVYALSDHNPL